MTRSSVETGSKVQRTALSMIGMAVLVTGHAPATSVPTNTSATASVTGNRVISAGTLAFGGDIHETLAPDKP